MSFAQRANVVSPCCNSFIISYKGMNICSKCGKNISYSDTTNMIVDVKYNTAAENNVNNIDNINLWHDARNFAEDDTLRLINIKCTNCQSFCRFARDLSKEHIYICSNPDCRWVFNKHMNRIDNKRLTHNTSPVKTAEKAAAIKTAKSKE